MQETSIKRDELMPRDRWYRLVKGEGSGRGGEDAALGKQRPYRSNKTRRTEPVDVARSLRNTNEVNKTCNGVHDDISTARAVHLYEGVDATVGSKSYIAAVT